MAEFLPDESRYVFIGVASVLFTIMFGCFLYHKGKSFCKKPIIRKRGKSKSAQSFKQRTRRNKFLMKKGETADKDEEIGAAESRLDKMRADIDAKYNNPTFWSTQTSGEPTLHNEQEMTSIASTQNTVQDLNDRN